MLALSATGLLAALPLAAQQPSPTATGSAIPRLSSGRPDFQGLWFKANAAYGPLGVPTGSVSVPALGTPGPPSPDTDDAFYKQGVRIPYRSEAVREKRWRLANEYLDGEPRCHLAGVPRSAEQPPYPHLIIQDEHSVTILYEYVHEPRIIPLDGSAHPKHYWAWDGDSRGHWEGDTLVIDVSNFNGRSWLDMTGNFVDENLHVVERYTMLDADTYDYSATITDPTVFSQPWQIRFQVKRQPAEDQLLEYSCLEGEGDRYHYTEAAGGRQRDAQSGHDTPAAGGGETVNGCLRGRLENHALSYSLEVADHRRIRVHADSSIATRMAELLDRDVHLTGSWSADRRQFAANEARALEEGCTASAP